MKDESGKDDPGTVAPSGQRVRVGLVPPSSFILHPTSPQRQQGVRLALAGAAGWYPYPTSPQRQQGVRLALAGAAGWYPSSF